MRTALLICFGIVLPALSWGQQLSQAQVTAFYNRTIQQYFEGMQQRDSTEREYIILQDSLLPTIRLQYPSFEIKLLTEDQIYQRAKHTKGHHIGYYKWFYRNHGDSVDLSFSGLRLEAKRTLQIAAGKVYFWTGAIGVSCGGVGLPEARLIFNQLTNRWRYLDSDALYWRYSMQLPALQDKLRAHPPKVDDIVLPSSD